MVQSSLIAIAALLSITSSVVTLPLAVNDMIEAREVSADLEKRNDNVLETRMMKKITSEIIPEIG
jgi:hypothetical protein